LVQFPLGRFLELGFTAALPRVSGRITLMEATLSKMTLRKTLEWMARRMKRIAPWLASILVSMWPCLCGVTPVGAQSLDPASVQPPDEENAEIRARLAGPLSLQDCVDIATTHNLPLAIAQLEHDAVATGVGGALGTWYPVFNLETIRTHARGDIDDFGLSPSGLGDVQTREDLSLLVKLTQRMPLGGSLDFLYGFDESSRDLHGGYYGAIAFTQSMLRDAGWRKATADVKDARLESAATAAALQSQLWRVMFDVKTAYYEVIRNRQLIEVNQRAIERDEHLLAFSQAKVEAKLATRRDVLSAEIILAQDRSRLVIAQTDYSAALDNLANILGVPFTPALQVDSVQVTREPIPIAVEPWVEKALKDNPEIVRAHLDVERSELAMYVAGNDRLPRLDLGLRYDEARGSIAPGEVVERRTEGRVLQGTVTFSYPILNKTLGNAYKAAQLRHQQSQRVLLERERQVVLRVRDAARNLQRITERIDVIEKTMQGAREKVEFANVNFQLGRASNLDITDAQKDLVEAESDWVDEVVSHHVELARLEALLGGFIQEAP